MDESLLHSLEPKFRSNDNKAGGIISGAMLSKQMQACRDIHFYGRSRAETITILIFACTLALPVGFHTNAPFASAYRLNLEDNTRKPSNVCELAQVIASMPTVASEDLFTSEWCNFAVAHVVTHVIVFADGSKLLTGVTAFTITCS